MTDLETLSWERLMDALAAAGEEQCARHGRLRGDTAMNRLPARLDEVVTLMDYQLLAQRTSSMQTDYPTLVHNACKLAGEAGEVAEKVAKIWRDDGSVISAEKALAIRAELGDVLWYVAEIARILGSSLLGVAEGNIAKLADRRARGVIKGSGDNR